MDQMEVSPIILHLSLQFEVVLTGRFMHLNQEKEDPRIDLWPLRDDLFIE